MKLRIKRIKKESDPDYIHPKIKDVVCRVVPKEETISNINENWVKFACELCDESIESSIAFALHSIQHSNDNRYYCHYCNFKSTLLKRIKKHMKVHSSTTGKYFQCEICSAQFPECVQAIEHKNFHSGEMPYKCETCEKHFMFSWLLYTHRRLFQLEFKNGSIFFNL